ncbi:MAG: ABC transporter permease [Flavobacteriaceae bacterium]|nr:MAG: ABC transporter permease [Flavobacteriaceae bacterium]
MNLPFFIAKKYFLSRKNTNIVNIITSITVLAILVGSSAMLIVLSAFSGLEDLNLSLYTQTNSDLKISAQKGKILPEIDKLTADLDRHPSVEVYAKTLEEKVYFTYKGKEQICALKGVDENFRKVIKIDTAVKVGEYLPFVYQNELLVSAEIAYKTGLILSEERPLRIFMPKPGKGMIKSEEEAFSFQDSYAIGIFSLNENWDPFILTSLESIQSLREVDTKTAYQIEVRLKKDAQPEQVKKELLGDKTFASLYKVETKTEQSGVFIKVMNTENFVIYLIFTLIIIIAYFTLAGAIVVIMVDKKKQIQTFVSMGMTKKDIRQIFYYTGLLIILIGTSLGIVLGTLVIFIQQHFPFQMINPSTPFPVVFKLKNYLMVLVTTLIIGWGIVKAITGFNKSI